MNKVVYNNCYGGFALSRKAVEFLANRKNIHLNNDIDIDICSLDKRLFKYRHDKDLVECVETLGKDASRACSDLKIKEIDSDRYFIIDYDGIETVITPEIMEKQWISINEKN